MKGSCCSRLNIPAFVLLTWMFLSTVSEDGIKCLEGIKNSLKDPDGKLSNWTFGNNSAGFICNFVGVSCWDKGENRVSLRGNLRAFSWRTGGELEVNWRRTEGENGAFWRQSRAGRMKEWQWGDKRPEARNIGARRADASREDVRRSGAWRMGERRCGFSVFVDNVSKRIRPSTLTDAFSGYGRVLDTYVAYNNKKREMKSSTFAFIRFSSVIQACKAVEKGHGRIMDGHKIRVFRAKDSRNGSNVPTNKQRGCNSGVRVQSFRDERSFKEALLGAPKSDPTGSGNVSLTNEHKGGPRSPAVQVKFVDRDAQQSSTGAGNEAAIVEVAKDETEWRSRCLVGEIKDMYNLELVQDALQSDGVSAKVSSWYGMLVVIQFTSAEEMQSIWARREEMLRLWFDQFELLEGFKGKRKLKLWVVLQDVPLQVWCDSFFRGIANRWGSFIKLDEDTQHRRRFDEARILLTANKLSEVPESLAIIVNGACNRIRIRVEIHEGDRRFIDGRSPFDAPANEDINASFPEPRMQENVNEPIFPEEDVGWSDDVEDFGQVDMNPVRCNKGPQMSLNSCGLVEVPILNGDGPVNKLIRSPNIPRQSQVVEEVDPTLSGESRLQDVQIEAVDEVCFIPTGGQLQRGKKYNNSSGYQALNFRAGMDKFRWWLGPQKGKSNENSKGRKGRKSKMDINQTIRSGFELQQFLGESGEPSPSLQSTPASEAVETLAVGNTLGIAFQAPEHIVIQNLEILEREDSNGC
ncbi:hypothetical protein HRI_004090800 [Hibiscus trionum]|uniref:RRM domain-containing protein n=1 Tax=Hibiscus trionum TaxID=183268 RepID=A0A9W7IYC8_HIBTR|nr:hypothetical protein HRI_004090800 [Hibiscus trionum]